MEADLWASFGVKGISMEWKDESAIDWTKVTGICGFWDGSCNDKVCGASITISFFIQELGLVIRFKKCGPVKGSNSLDAELGGCAMLIESLKIGLPKSGKSSCSTSCVSARLPAILLYIVCIFLWIYQAWASTATRPHACLAQRVSCGSGRFGQCLSRGGCICGN